MNCYYRRVWKTSYYHPCLLNLFLTICGLQTVTVWRGKKSVKQGRANTTIGLEFMIVPTLAVGILCLLTACVLAFAQAS